MPVITRSTTSSASAVCFGLSAKKEYLRAEKYARYIRQYSNRYNLSVEEINICHNAARWLLSAHKLCVNALWYANETFDITESTIVHIASKAASEEARASIRASKNVKDAYRRLKYISRKRHFDSIRN
jgi:hypothetical protein